MTEKVVAEVTTEAKKKKVAIVGFAETSRHMAPYSDESFEIWGLNELYMQIPRWTRWFQLHSREVFVDDFSDRDKEHVEHLSKMTCPIYMCRHYEDIPNSIPFPLEEAIKYFSLCPKRKACKAEGKSCMACREMDAYFTNSISYMIALAIMEGFEEIHVYGVDMAQDTEYGTQKPSCEFFIGWARGQGIEVVLPKEADLCRTFCYYGYEKEPQIKQKFRLKKDEMERRIKEHEEEIRKIDAAMQDLTNKKVLQHRFIDHLRGGSQICDYFIRNW